MVDNGDGRGGDGGKRQESGAFVDQQHVVLTEESRNRTRVSGL
jgi:hypothetical protein